ncbi:MAG: S41 family peptidase [Patescibacteria group bacterium]|jgi:carboxyl-terminal processing protease
MLRKTKNILKKILKGFLVVIIVAFIFFSGTYLAVVNKTVSQVAEKEALYLGALTGKYQKVDGKWSQNIDFDYYWKVWDIIKNSYVNKDEISDKEMFYGSLDGLVSSLGDPYSEFMDPQENKSFNEDMSGTFEGIGAELGVRDELLTVISPIDGAPAQKAGIMAGDKILEINGESTQNMDINEAVSKIKGNKGTEVILSIFRDGFEDIKKISIIRDTVVVKSLTYEKLDNNIFLISINSFNDDTQALFLQAVKEIQTIKPQGIIIDLRNNPGGYLETAVSILGEWVNGEVAVIEKFSDSTTTEYRANGSNSLKDYPTVVLINGGSASASEILAGALKDYGKATIIGEESYGKGSVQVVENLADGSAVKVTVAKWLTPYGQSINETGITPDKEIELTYDDYENGRDPQLDEAKNFLNK